MDKETLQKILESDKHGLLEAKTKRSNAVNADQQLLNSFEEINKFIDKNGHEPRKLGTWERQVHTRLKFIREDEKKVMALLDEDRHGLLKEQKKNIDDNVEAESIFDIKHKALKPREKAEHIDKRKICKDFEKYKNLFVEVHEQLKDGTRKAMFFEKRDANLTQGNFYILNGLMLYLESVVFTSEEKTVDGKRFRRDGRTRCIFENGTESKMLYQSLGKRLYENGRFITRLNDDINEEFYESMGRVTKEDKQTGWIYILSSMSTDDKIKSFPNLYKIGFSAVPIKGRISNAENEPTYLMAPVVIQGSYKCFNANPQKVEKLLHNFFAKACLEIDVFDNKGKRHTPREWFDVPIHVIEEAINLIELEEIVNYKYDHENEEIIPK